MKCIAHRGYSLTHRDNSIEAIRDFNRIRNPRALKLGWRDDNPAQFVKRYTENTMVSRLMYNCVERVSWFCTTMCI